MAEVAWSGKHTVEISILFHNTSRAVAFNQANARRSGFNACLPFDSKVEPIETLPGCGDRDSSVIGTDYRTGLGEARRVR